MKYLLFVAALSFSVDAVEYELNLSYFDIKQELFGDIEFNQKALMLGITVWHNDFGISAAYGKGDNVANSIPHEIFYENEINSIYTIDFKYKYNITEELAAVLSAGHVDYETTWHVDGLKPAGWHTNSDSDYSYGIGLRYKISPRFSLSAAYSHLYGKHKKGYGDEKTTAFIFGVSYRFGG